MPQTQTAARSLVSYYLDLVPLHGAINVGLRSAQEETMISLLGAPQLPLTADDQPQKASARVKQLAVAKALSAHVHVTGIRPAVDSLDGILKKAFAQETAAGRNLESVLRDDGMLAVRYRRPTNKHPSTTISNHAWGTAIDFKIVDHPPPGNTHGVVPQFIAVLLPFFNAAGWYSGVGFADTMHFEVADGTMHQWASQGDL